MREIDQVVQRRSDTAWLKKRMLAKRGDHIAKALAGSFHAAHDTEISTVGKYQNSAFGNGSFIRRGDGKQAYLASLQNHSNIMLRMLAWRNTPAVDSTSSRGATGSCAPAGTPRHRRGGLRTCSSVPGCFQHRDR